MVVHPLGGVGCLELGKFEGVVKTMIIQSPTETEPLTKLAEGSTVKEVAPPTGA